MAEYLNLNQIRTRLASAEDLSREGFELLQAVAHHLAPVDGEPEPLLVEAAIRLLDRKDELAGYAPVVDAIIRAVGLFPYLEPEGLSTADQLAFEAHRPFGMNDLVFHRVQAELYRNLMSGENIMLSAPTSFGKSLIIDALIASGKYRNIAIIVPTLALIDETRRRLSRFGEKFKVVTHPSQRTEEQNIFVMTQERILDMSEMPELDLFVIDEFYKLDTRRDSERATLLNSALHRLWKTGAQFLMLGPNIQGITEDLPSGFRATFIHTDFKTVAADVVRVHADRTTERDRLLEVMEGLEGPTLVFCRSPQRARNVAEWMVEGGFRPPREGSLDSAIAWLSEHYDPEWYVVDALRHGIGVHTGRLPRSIAQWMVRAFNDGRLKYLICTSTLIEGVNTRAKNVVIFDSKIARSVFDYFTFNNIRGRSGRMFHHFVGKVILFHEPPPPTLPVVDIPGLSQSDGADESLLIQLDAEDLTEVSRQRVGDLYAQDHLSIETLRENSGIDPSRQVELAIRIARTPALARAMSWSGYPNYETLVLMGDLMLKDLKAQRGRVAGVSSGAQLAYLTERFRRSAGSFRALIEEYGTDAKSRDDAVEDALEFVRYWPGHHLPRYLMALDRIQREVLPRLGIDPGDYRFYAGVVESLFMAPPLVSLEEYGVPIQVAARWADLLRPDGDLDALLEELAGLPIEELEMSEFERELLQDAIDHL